MNNDEGQMDKTRETFLSSKHARKKDREIVQLL